MCHVLDVSVSGFYSFQKRKQSLQSKRKEELMEEISHLYHVVHGQMAGSWTITKDLQETPKYQNIYRSRVASLMNEIGLKCKTQKRFVVTTDSNHDEAISPNLLDRNFNPELHHRYLIGDITYIRVAKHWVYLSVFIDLFSRKVVAWDLSDSLCPESTCTALDKFIHKYGNVSGLMVHSDRGIQYACKDFRKKLKDNKIIQSMSRKGNCWDNAVAESFFHTLKTRLTYHRTYETMEELQRDLYWYIEIYYNRVRKHSANNWVTPEKKELNFYQTKKVA